MNDLATTNKIDVERIKQSINIADIISRYIELKQNGREYRACCPFHEEKTPSFTVVPDKGFYHCFGCGAHGDVIDFVTEFTGASFKEAIESLGGKINGKAPVPIKTTRIDPYADYNPTSGGFPIQPGNRVDLINPKRDGATWTVNPTAAYEYPGQGYVLRIDMRDGKKITPMIRWCKGPQGEGWHCYPFSEPRPLYGYAPGEKPVLIVEGEKARDAALNALNGQYCVITWAGGCNGVDKSDWTALKGRDVTIWPDHDEPGCTAAANIRGLLTNVATSIKEIQPPSDAPKGWDVADREWQSPQQLIEWMKGNTKQENLAEDEPDFPTLLNLIQKDKENEDLLEQAIGLILEAKPIARRKMRQQLKDVSSMKMSDIRECEKNIEKDKKQQTLTHSELAEQYIQSFSADAMPVGCAGKIWHFCDKQRVYLPTELRRVSVSLGKRFRDQALCRKEADYKGIASHIYTSLCDENFFNEAPLGIGVPDGFYCIENNELKLLEATPETRLRFRLEVMPDFSGEPELLLNTLRESFSGCHPEEQLRQLRMFFGMALFGVQAKRQLCLFLMGVGGSFKSQLLKILRAMVPPEYVAVASPTDFDREYVKASLAGKLFNLVPEISADVPIPSAEFKAITGSDLIQAREPYGLPFSFECKAANWFNGNFFMTTKDQSSAFWRRWAVLRFVNGKPESERDETLSDRIISDELPKVLGWAIEGIKDYLENGVYFSPAHHEAMIEWGMQSNSVAAWLHDDELIEEREDRSSVPPLKFSDAYKLYKDWCLDSGRRPCEKGNFKNRMQTAGHIASGYKGYTSYKMLKKAPKQYLQTVSDGF